MQVAQSRLLIQCGATAIAILATFALQFDSLSFLQNLFIVCAILFALLAIGWLWSEKDSQVKPVEFNNSNERYKSFIALSTEGIWRAEVQQKISIDLSAEKQVQAMFDYGFVAECNDAMAKMYGYSQAKELIGKPLRELVVSSDPNNWEYLKAFVTSGYELRGAESREVDRNGTPKFFLNSLVGVIEDGYLVRAWGTQQDITTQKIVQDELVLSSQRLQTIIESSEDAIVTKTLEGIITSWNPAAEHIFGFKAEEVIGKSIMAIIPPERQDEELHILASLSEGKRVQHLETVRVTKNKDRIYISVSSSPIKDSSGKIIGAAKIARDITNQKRYEQELQEREAKYRLLAEERTWALNQERAARSEVEKANRIKDEFLLTLSHELRTPLNAILGWSQILARKEANAARLKEGLSVIERNARGQAQIIDDLLDMNRIMSGKIRLEINKLNVVSIVKGAVESIMPDARLHEISIATQFPTDPMVVNADTARLSQILWNLLTNAVKFTPPKGGILVSIEKTASSIAIIVKDSGQGIKAEFLPFIFDRFRQGDASTTRKQRGLGLGLSIVRQLVELHGGAVVAESAGEGKGAIFTVTLPLAQEMLMGRQQEDSSKNSSPLWEELASLQGLTILVVDDEKDTRDLLSIVLSEQGATIFTAASVREALNIIESQAVDVILSDIGMPEQDGYELIRQVRTLPIEKGGSIPAIAVSAFARNEDRQTSIAAGFQMHVSKPVEPTELIAAIAKVSPE